MKNVLTELKNKMESKITKLKRSLNRSELRAVDSLDIETDIQNLYFRLRIINEAILIDDNNRLSWATEFNNSLKLSLENTKEDPSRLHNQIFITQQIANIEQDLWEICKRL